MSELYYRIKRTESLPSTTWIGATGCKRKFDPNEKEFIVNETELAICLHHGNFKLMGPALTIESTPTAEAVPEPEIEAETEIETEAESEDETEEESAGV